MARALVKDESLAGRAAVRHEGQRRHFAHCQFCLLGSSVYEPEESFGYSRVAFGVLYYKNALTCTIFERKAS